MDNETRAKKMTKDEKWLLYVQNARIEERNKAIDEVVKLVFEDDGDFKQFESPASIMTNIQALKGKQQ